jgi:hypothetical protein
MPTHIPKQHAAASPRVVSSCATVLVHRHRAEAPRSHLSKGTLLARFTAILRGGGAPPRRPRRGWRRRACTAARRARALPPPPPARKTARPASDTASERRSGHVSHSQLINTGTGGMEHVVACVRVCSVVRVLLHGGSGASHLRGAGLGAPPRTARAPGAEPPDQGARGWAVAWCERIPGPPRRLRRGAGPTQTTHGSEERVPWGWLSNYASKGDETLSLATPLTPEQTSTGEVVEGVAPVPGSTTL